VYSFADDLISQTRYDLSDTPTTNYVQADGFGSTRWLTDATGAITDQIDYDAFGNEIGRSGSTAIEHLYRGEAFDPNVGFYYLRARWMDPRVGRFTQQDAFAGFAQDPRSLHKYLYAHSDPVNGRDPSGYLTLASQMTGISVNSILAATAVSLSSVVLFKYGKELADATRSFALWDVVAVSQFRARNSQQSQAIPNVTAIAAPAPAPQGHHTIPVYLCGSMSQVTSVITQPEHVAIHAQIAMIRIALDGAEEYADRTVGKRRSEDILRIAQTEPGRASIANALDLTYYYGGWWSRGLPTIKSAFENERSDFVSGRKTSLPWCSRNGSP
jgi:RHS repeat-associated protein